MRRRLQFSIVLLALTALATPVESQPSISLGARVRVIRNDTAQRIAAGTGDTWLIGRVVASTPLSIAIEIAPTRPIQSIDFGDAWRIEISRGWTDRRRSGMVIGGLVSGAAFVAFACAFSDGSCDIGNNVGGFALYYATGAIPGVFLGGAIGKRVRGRELWDPIALAGGEGPDP